MRNRKGECNTLLYREDVQILMAGILDTVGGIILGKHEQFDDNGTGKQPCEILLEVLNGRKIPLLADFDCCHTHPMFAMPIGCQVKLNATEQEVTLLESPLVE